MKNVEARTAGGPQDAVAGAAPGDLTHALAPSFDAGLAVLRDWQGLMQAGAEMIGENIKTTADDMKRFAEYKTAEEFGKASAAFGQALTKRWLDSSQKLATLSAEYASRRIQAGTKMVSPAARPPRES